MGRVRGFGMFGMALALPLIFSVAPVSAKRADQPRPEIFRKLIDCRTVADSASRLACYDAQVAKLDEAESRNELVVVDKEQVRKARRGLFGLSLPDLGGVFGHGDEKGDDAQGLSEIETTIASAKEGNYGKWIIVLADGARWEQTEARDIRDPKPGQTIKIRKAALGSFFANINGATAIRVKRVN